jgi:transposase
MLPGEGVVQEPAKVPARQQVALEKVMETRACWLLQEVNQSSNEVGLWCCWEEMTCLSKK